MTNYVDVLDKDGNVVGFVAQDPGEELEVTRLTPHEFRSRFTTEEKVAMYDSNNPIIRVFLDDVQFADYIDIDNQIIIDWVNYLVSEGLITSGRATEVLNPA